MKYLINVFLLLFLYLSSGHLFASSNLSAEEARALFTGNTAEGERRQGVKVGQGPLNMVENFPEGFVMFFAEDGTAKRKIGERHETGKWRLTDNGDQCIQWEGKDEKCAPVYREGDIYKRVTKTTMGRVRWETRYIRFTPGNKYDL